MNKDNVRILVAEDEPRYIWAIQTNLEARGYHVLTASDGQTAVELAATELEDEPVWDGQARSSRYQDFSRSGFVTPPGMEARQQSRYREAGASHELYPDIILIDGGLGQLHAALEAFGQMDVKPPMVLSLAKKFGTAAVEDACAAALEMGVHEYRFVRRYLERAPQLTLRQVDPLIRELVHYRDLINLRTQEPEDEPH